MSLFGLAEPNVKFPEVKKLDSLIRTCYHRLEQMVDICQRSGNMGYNDVLKNDLTHVLINLNKKTNAIDLSLVLPNEKEKLDQVFDLTQRLYQDLTQKTRVGNTTYNLAFDLKALLKTFI